MEKIAPGQGAQPTQILIGEQPQERCTACEEPGPQVSYTYAGGSVIVRLQATCDALWQQERQA